MEDFNEFIREWEWSDEIKKGLENFDNLSIEEQKSLLQKMKQQNKAFGEAVKESKKALEKMKK